MSVRSIQVGDATLAVEESGSGPAVVLLHAGIATRRMWEPQWRWLHKAFRAVRFDMRGFGDSPMVPGQFSAARDVVGVLDELGIDRAILMGCSYGGATAIHVALTHPERVAGLVLVGSGVHGYQDSEPVDPMFDEMENAWNAKDYERVLTLEEKAFIIGMARDEHQLDLAFRKVCREMNRTKLQWAEIEAEYVDDASFDVESLSSIAVPTLVVVGDEDVPFIQRQSEFIAKQIPQASLRVLRDSSHLPNLEHPDEFDAVVSPWLLQG